MTATTKDRPGLVHQQREQRKQHDEEQIGERPRQCLSSGIDRHNRRRNVKKQQMGRGASAPLFGWVTLLVVAMATLPEVQGRTWKAIVSDSVLNAVDISVGRELVEGDPFFTKTSFRPTSSPTITAIPTPFPTTPFPTRTPTTAPTGTPTILPTAAPSATDSPTKSPAPSVSPQPSRSNSPTTSEPSSSPSYRAENVDGNGGCFPTEILHEIVLHDTWNDGWDGRNLTITRLGDPEPIVEVEATEPPAPEEVVVIKTVTIGSMEVTKTKTELEEASTTDTATDPGSDLGRSQDGGSTTTPEALEELTPNPVYTDGIRQGGIKYGYVCLQPSRCYEAHVPGGWWSEEITWEVRPLLLGDTTGFVQPAFVTGGAPANCTFSIMGTGPSCPSSCRLAGSPVDSTNSTSPWHPVKPPVSVNTTDVDKNETIVENNSTNTTTVPPMANATNSTPPLGDDRSTPDQGTPVGAAPIVPITAAPVTLIPTVVPSAVPSGSPSATVVDSINLQPALSITMRPRSHFTPEPTGRPTAAPTAIPTPLPTKAPTLAPTAAPTTKAPTPVPTLAPTVATIPDTPVPTKAPTAPLTASPVTLIPTEAPTTEPTKAPTKEPTKAPTKLPTTTLTAPPTNPPTPAPTEAPTVPPTLEPTEAPTDPPTPEPVAETTPSPVSRTSTLLNPGASVVTSSPVERTSSLLVPGGLFVTPNPTPTPTPAPTDPSVTFDTGTLGGGNLGSDRTNPLRGQADTADNDTFGSSERRHSDGDGGDGDENEV